MADEGFLIHIEGRDYDVADLTLDEVEIVEEMCGGKSLDQVNFGSAKTLKALAYVLLRRDDPTVTLERVGGIKYNVILSAGQAAEVEPLVKVAN